MTVLFWIIDLLIPVTMAGLGLLFTKKPPSSINAVFGYRTKRSRASQAAWDFAHAYGGKV